MDFCWYCWQSFCCLTYRNDRIYCYKRKRSTTTISGFTCRSYTSYKVSVSEEGYAISYKANDPKTAYITKDIKEKGGFLGLANNTTKVAEEYFMDGQTNQGGAVSNTRSWLDQKPGLTHEQAAEISAERIACIKAIGSGEGTGRVVGTSIGAAAAPSLSTIPFVGWVAAGWVAMFGGNQGAEIGGNMAEDMSKDC